MNSPVFSFSSQEEARNWKFPPDSVTLCRGRERGERGTQIFLVPLVALILQAPRVQEPFNCFLHFSQRELVHVLLWNWCPHGRKVCLRLPIPLNSWHQYLLITVITYSCGEAYYHSKQLCCLWSAFSFPFPSPKLLVLDYGYYNQL